MKQRVKVAYWISSNSSFIQYCDSNIGLFSIASPLVIALPTFDSKVVTLNLFASIFVKVVLSLFYVLKGDSKE